MSPSKWSLEDQPKARRDHSLNSETGYIRLSFLDVADALSRGSGLSISGGRAGHVFDPREWLRRREGTW